MSTLSPFLFLALSSPVFALAMGLVAPAARAECERQCKPGQTRDVNGCCVGGATPTPAPKPTPPEGPKAASPPARLDGGPAGLDWVVIPGGTFSMRSIERDDENKPAHQETLARFAVARTETTVAQYGRCVLAGKCSVPEKCEAYLPDLRTYGQGDKANHPVNCVTWFQARDFCAWAGGRLPTEEEWVYAAKGKKDRRFPWGDFGLESAPGPVGNFADVSYASKRGGYIIRRGYDDRHDGTSPVGAFLAGRSPFGLDDMAGNVSEWVTTSPETDFWFEASGPFIPSDRYTRGGSFESFAEEQLEVARRGRQAPLEPAVSLGFRCARTL